MPNTYSTPDFEAKYTYTGSDLGATWSEEKTSFRLWAPTATSARVNLYETGNPDEADLIRQVRMKRDVCGTWVAEIPGNLNGIYYTFGVTVRRKRVEACDPYAMTTGVNGQRAMILDMSTTNPEGWDKDQDPNAGIPFTDAVIAEAHIRDFSIHPSANSRHPGKYLGMIETGTKTPSGIPTGLDHYKKLGITHLHLLPMYDYGSVDESRLEEPQYNWGYDPVNFNVPEGSYCSDPFHGEVRVKEMKQMIKGLHDNGISVVMDVVYNHVYEANDFCFNQLVPQYFSRTNGRGVYSNGSACGNDTASERSMVHKYIVDSVCYWADEYHIDGFRFDLVGLIDCDTINDLVNKVHEKHPNVIFYGEGWSMDTGVTKPNVNLCTQLNAHLVPEFAFFSDTIRDALRGSVFDMSIPGFITGAEVDKNVLHATFMGVPFWAPEPTQSINYVSCHDNNTLIDRITLAVPDAPREIQVRMNNLAAAFNLTAQGIPFFQAGEEMLRTKPDGHGGLEHNSYASPDSVNAIRWDSLEEPEVMNTYKYYQGLLKLRKAHDELRLATREEIMENVTPLRVDDPHAVAFGIGSRSEHQMIAIFNAGYKHLDLNLPNGKWNLMVNARKAGTEVLDVLEKKIQVEPLSAMILVKAV